MHIRNTLKVGLGVYYIEDTYGRREEKKVYVVIIQVKWSVQVIHDMKIGP